MTKRIFKLFILPMVVHLVDTYKSEMQPTETAERTLDAFLMWVHMQANED